MLDALIATAVVFGIVILIMAVGVIFKGRCLRGSCGGPGVFDADGNDLRCSQCPMKDKHKTKEECAADHDCE